MGNQINGRPPFTCWQLVKHRVREALRLYALTRFETRQPETFGGIKSGIDELLTLLAVWKIFK